MSDEKPLFVGVGVGFLEERVEVVG